MMAGIEEVLALARRVRSNAHAPYSGFRVGAVLEADDGTLHVGCNVENASLGLTLCAERGAMAAAVVAGHVAFRRIVLVADGEDPVPPCGGCRESNEPAVHPTGAPSSCCRLRRLGRLRARGVGLALRRSR